MANQTTLNKLLNGAGLSDVWERNFQLIQSVTGDVDVATKGTLQSQIDNISVGVDGTTIDKNTSNQLYAKTATNTTLGVSKPDNDTIKIDSNGTISVSDASNTQKGVVKIDNSTIVLNQNGEISSVGGSGGSTPIATPTVAGKVMPDDVTIKVDSNGVINVVNATLTQKGLVMPDGTTLDFDQNGKLTVIGGGGSTITLIKKTQADYDALPLSDKQDLSKIYFIVDNGGNVIVNGDLSNLPVATPNTVGVVKPDGISTTVDADGTIHAKIDTSKLDKATTTKLGVVKVDGNTINVDTSGEISLPKIFNVMVSQADTPWLHNKVYRGEDITKYFLDGSLLHRVGGTNGFKLFEDLYLGDTFDLGVEIKAPGSSVSGSSVVQIAAFDWFRYVRGQIFPHQISCIPKETFGSGKMNNFMIPSTDSEEGYIHSHMDNNILGGVTNIGNSNGTISQQLYAVLGNNLLAIPDYLTNSLNHNTPINRFGGHGQDQGMEELLGASKNAEWATRQVRLMSEIETMGTTIYSSSAYDTGVANRMLPLFEHITSEMKANGSYVWFWLKDMASKAHWCTFTNEHSGGYDYSNDSLAVKPIFTIKGN